LNASLVEESLQLISSDSDLGPRRARSRQVDGDQLTGSDDFFDRALAET
jgi:hypothetical protein